MTTDRRSTPAPPGRPSAGIGWGCGVLVLLAATMVVAAATYVTRRTARRPVDEPAFAPSREVVFPNQSDAAGRGARQLTVWWGDFPMHVRARTLPTHAARSSNIHPGDYIGPDRCGECHPKNHADWSGHAHRWMNAVANAETVKGDFSGVTIDYMGGQATFFQEDGEFRMRLEREASRTFTVTQTIGSRFFQYYIGKQTDGPDTSERKAYRFDHVLPLGYWLEPGEWVPTVHVDEDVDGKRTDPFDWKSYSRKAAVYAETCNVCHTTFALGDLLCSNAERLSREVPVNAHWSTWNYLRSERGEYLSDRAHSDFTGEQVALLLRSIDAWEAPSHAVTLGISCEACHLGGRAHARDPQVSPDFFPQSPHLRVDRNQPRGTLRRRHDDLNWACGRCHTGRRPQFAGGMSTWNSTEYSDAMRGSCYSELRCIDCHSPHKGIGPKWSLTPAQDDALCIRCHQQFSSSQAQAAHSHHPAGSEGARCMNCHMPRINEGMQDVVRTHTIFSPTQPDMIHANHPNACNQCHTDKSLDWTESYLNAWYGASFDAGILADMGEDRTRPAPLVWMDDEQEGVRLVGADVLFRTQATWARNALLEMLDDPYLINRQFARMGLESMLGVRLADFGYQFYMTPEERRQPLARIKASLAAERPR